MQGTGSDPAASLGLLIIRVGFGVLLATHGWGKVEMLFSGDPSQFPDPVGLGPKVSLMLAAGAEFGCAIMVALGLFTRLAAIPVVIAMGVAAAVVHKNDPWLSGVAAKLFDAGKVKTWHSKEPALLFLIPFLALVFTGGGRLSLDWIIFGKKRSRPAAAA